MRQSALAAIVLAFAGVGCIPPELELPEAAGAGGSSAAGGASGSGGSGAFAGGGGATLLPARSLAIGGEHTCARQDTLPYCWGLNANGQIGDMSFNDSKGAVQLYYLQAVHRFAVGGSHTCADVNDGEAWCWGNNQQGQVGVIGDSMYPIAKAVVLDSIALIAAGGLHTCAVLEVSDALHCWGDNSFGQSGELSEGAQIAGPTLVANAHGARQLALGANFTCALFSDGQTRCWGDNTKGQLGGGTTSAPADQPVDVALPASVLELAAGEHHVCARLANDEIHCWGDNSWLQLGVPDTTERGPVLSSGSWMGATHLGAGVQHTCIRTENGTASCWGSGSFHELGQVDPTASSASPVTVDVDGQSVSELVGGSGHTCVRTADGSAWCWGRNASGQLGTGETGPGSPPKQVVGL